MSFAELQCGISRLQDGTRVLTPVGAFGNAYEFSDVAYMRYRRVTFVVVTLLEVDPEQLKAAVERQHGGTATYVESVPVKEVFDGKTVWEGTVAVFDLLGSRHSTRAYAWSSPVEGSANRRFYAVLHLGGIRSPQDAVKAAIVAETRGK